MSKTCLSCGCEFKPRRSSSVYCSRRCLWDENAKREPHNKGAGVGWIDKRGYRWIYVNENGKRVAKREHRHVMELYLGRKLRPEELVHHINENKADNRIENLTLEDWGMHTSEHHSGSLRSDQAKKTMQVIANYKSELKAASEINSVLLDALKAMVDAERAYEWGDYSSEELAALEKAHAAIAKATGRADSGQGSQKGKP